MAGVEALQHLADRGILALGQSLSVLAVDSDVLHDHLRPLG
ncbi:hypothetical protein ACWGJB_27055 [Streptomyces sp. NPDC054813]